MIVLAGFLLDCLGHALSCGWYTYFTIAAVLHMLVQGREALFDMINIFWFSIGLFCLCALDVIKYGRVGASWLSIMMVYFLYELLRHYFLSNKAWLLVLMVLFVALLDFVFVQGVLFRFAVGLDMTANFFFGTLATLTLAFLGARGSRSRTS